MDSLILNLKSVALTDEQFFRLCQNNRDFQFERNARGDLIIMPPVGGETSHRNLEIAYQLQGWSRSNSLGIAFDSSGGFKLPNGSERSPDAAWLTLERWQNLSPQVKQKFIPLCPDFVLELRSPSDSLKGLREKMREYLENGARLGWLIDARSRRIEIYRPGQNVEILTSPETVSGEDVLPDFVLDCSRLW